MKGPGAFKLSLACFYDDFRRHISSDCVCRLPNNHKRTIQNIETMVVVVDRWFSATHQAQALAEKTTKYICANGL